MLYNFQGGTGGWGPLGSLTRDAAGNLYGTTLGGGDDVVDCDCGIVFKLDATGTETVLQNFTGSNGARLAFGLTRDNAGTLYGSTVYGGLAVSGLCSGGCGTVFKLDAAGTESVLHTFTGKVDGRYPVGILIRDAAGNLYGTTQLGGAFNFGTVFKIGLTGRETVLHSFTGGADGGNPGAGVIEDAAGNLYGVAENGGANGYGTVFKLTP
ncbi:MAG: choice-of-anchor tandem repeat GloVer-containing protein [Candidatus Sulfotelmatobacter sp.]